MPGGAIIAHETALKYVAPDSLAFSIRDCGPRKANDARSVP